MKRAISRMGVLQVDSVNAFERSHYIPLFSRLGSYDRSRLDALLRHDVPAPELGDYTEYIAHEATILPIDDWPLWAWHRDAPERDSFEQWASTRKALIDEVRAEFAERGPRTVSDLEHPENVSTGGGWWNRNGVRWASRYLFGTGELVVVGRRRFERVFALADHVLPPAALVGIPKSEAILELVRRAAVAYGVATLDDLADYWRLPVAHTRVAVAELESAGEIEPVRVEGWTRPAWLASGTRVPRSVDAAALLSPFDPLVWYRPRAERLFGFHYRIAIYTPAAERKHGYYVLPVLIGDQLVGRLDLKSDRRAGVLRVQHAHVEPEFAGDAAALAARVAPLLAEAAEWQGLGEVAVAPVGTWAEQLGRRV